MTAPARPADLRHHVHALVDIRTAAGETLRAILDWVNEELQEITYDRPVSTSEASFYTRWPPRSGFALPWRDVLEIRRVPAAEAIEEVLGPARAPLLAKYGPRRGEQLGWVGGDRHYQGRTQPDGDVAFRGGGK